MKFLKLVSAIRWMSPRSNASILLVDVTAEDLVDLVPSSESAIELAVRGEAWYISPLIVWYLIIGCRYCLRRQVGLRGLYVYAVARSVKAKLLITFIDNNNWDLGLVDLRQFRCICIQNGYRPLPQLENKHFDYYCTLNQLPSDRFAEFNIRVDHLEYTGSLRLSLFQRNQRLLHKNIKPSKPNILFPSQYRSIRTGASNEVLLRQMEIGHGKVCRWLSRMQEEGLIKVTIALATRRGRPEVQREELDFYEKLFSTPPVFSFRSQDRWATYNLFDQVSAVVGTGSTIIHEAAEVGLPTLFCFGICSTDVAEYHALGIKPGTANVLAADATYDLFRSAVMELCSQKGILMEKSTDALVSIQKVVNHLLETHN